MSDRPLTGLFPPEIVGPSDFPRLPADLLDQCRALPDLTGNLADGMDELGLATGVPGIAMRPNAGGHRIAGPAVTLHNVPIDPTDPQRATLPAKRLGDIECYNLAEPGDVLVIQGLDGISSMGGISATIGRRVGLAGAVVAGSVRDVSHARSAGFPIWASSVTPASGKFRLRSAEIMKPVLIGGVLVRPGDLVAADETGVCFVPYSEAARVLERARSIGDRERSRLARIDDEIPRRHQSRES